MPDGPVLARALAALDDLELTPAAVEELSALVSAYLAFNDPDARSEAVDAFLIASESDAHRLQ